MVFSHNLKNYFCILAIFLFHKLLIYSFLCFARILLFEKNQAMVLLLKSIF